MIKCCFLQKYSICVSVSLSVSNLLISATLLCTAILDGERKLFLLKHKSMKQCLQSYYNFIIYNIYTQLK